MARPVGAVSAGTADDAGGGTRALLGRGGADDQARSAGPRACAPRGTTVAVGPWDVTAFGTGAGLFGRGGADRARQGQKGGRGPLVGR
ncbi:hypothetical protein SNE510_32980 [Streptomyces sp. NE5-10]|nr:hypothetical protein SNE510_32980 [Streptomyces sp. NE5-10]